METIKEITFETNSSSYVEGGNDNCWTKEKFLCRWIKHW